MKTQRFFYFTCTADNFLFTIDEPLTSLYRENGHEQITSDGDEYVDALYEVIKGVYDKMYQSMASGSLFCSDGDLMGCNSHDGVQPLFNVSDALIQKLNEKNLPIPEKKKPLSFNDTLRHALSLSAYDRRILAIELMKTCG